jgi:septal ring factor EnvC (AmiA/AmiB activator)
MDDSKALHAILDKLGSLEEGQKTTDAQLDKIGNRLSKIENRLSKIEEDSEITRSGVNTLLDWAEKVQVQVSIPLYRKGQD